MNEVKSNKVDVDGEGLGYEEMGRCPELYRQWKMPFKGKKQLGAYRLAVRENSAVEPL